MFNTLSIKHLLEGKKISKEEFAQEIGLKKQTFYNYINGTTKIPAEILPKIAEVLGVPITYFFDEGDNTIIDNTTNGDKSNIVSPVNNKFDNKSSQNFNIGDNYRDKEIEKLKIEKESLKEKLKNCKEQNEEYKTLLRQKDQFIESILNKK